MDDINFYVQGNFLRGDKEIVEPHSFVVSIQATHQGKSYQWKYDNFEGRTKISDDIAKAMKISTERVGSATLTDTMKVYGKLTHPNDASRQISARFDGEIKAVYVALGDTVKKGQKLLSIESNESLQTYLIKAPINGVITKRAANPYEQTQGKMLLEITNLDTLIAELTIFPKQLTKLKSEANVTLVVNGHKQSIQSQLFQSNPQITYNQAKIVKAKINNKKAKYTAGAFVIAQIEVETFDVPLAVKRSGLQSFRDFTVVYAKVNDEYEVRMLELGRVSGEWIEVLGGIKSGTEYVVENSYIIKADVEKSGASHDH